MLSKNNLTWGEWCQEWVEIRRLEPNTEVSQVALINKYILPKWSGWVLGDINRHEVQKWVAELTKSSTSSNKPLKAAIVIKIVGIFSTSLAAAIKAEILEVNVAHRADLPKVMPAKDRWLSHEEEAEVKKYLPTAQDRAIMATLTGTAYPKGIHTRTVPVPPYVWGGVRRG